MISDRGKLFAAGGFADVHEAKFNGKRVCIKVLRMYSEDVSNDTKMVRWTLDHRGLPSKHPFRQAFHREVVVWKRLQHPNIVPFLGVPTGMSSFEIVCDWMENGRITEYVAKSPQVNRIGLVSDFVPAVAISSRMSNLTALGCGGWPSLPPFKRNHTWRLERRKFPNSSVAFLGNR